mmetsp:Transcript_23763/g.51945  ORF Transcript_23763/g.51945 Transcript_23763/m.51945 type:complete len:559 (+) Transcript_23763:2-1678(+)
MVSAAGPHQYQSTDSTSNNTAATTRTTQMNPKSKTNTNASTVSTTIGSNPKQQQQQYGQPFLTTTTDSNANHHQNVPRASPPDLLSQPTVQRSSHSKKNSRPITTKTMTTTKDVAFQELQNAILDSLGKEKGRRKGKRKRTGGEELLYRKWKRDSDDTVGYSNLSSLSSSSEDHGDGNRSCNSTDTLNVNAHSNSNANSTYLRNTNGPRRRFVGTTTNLNSTTKTAAASQNQTKNLPTPILGGDSGFNSRIVGNTKSSWIFDSFPPAFKIRFLRNGNNLVDDCDTQESGFSSSSSSCSCCSSNSSCQWVLTTTSKKKTTNSAVVPRNSMWPRQKKTDATVRRRAESYYGSDSISGRPKSSPEKERPTTESLRREDSCESDISSLGTETVDALPSIRCETADEYNTVGPVVLSLDNNNGNVSGNHSDNSPRSTTLQTIGKGDVQQPLEFSFSPPHPSQHHYGMGDQLQNESRGGEPSLRNQPGEEILASFNRSHNLSRTTTRTSITATATATATTGVTCFKHHHEPHRSRLRESAITSTPDPLGKFFPVKEVESYDDVS